MAKNSTYRVVDLFGNEKVHFIQNEKQNNKTLFHDFDSFVDKFEPLKTTDDCYTPPVVYNAVVKYVNSRFNLEGFEIIRPFYPGGDFESIYYPEKSIVIDNPPFSIISRIARYYIENNVKFFLFAPHLTLLSVDLDCTAVIAGCDIIYENGANVKTSFLTNLFGDIRVMSAHELYEEVNRINANNKVNLPKYVYPEYVLTVSQIQKLTENGIYFEVRKSETSHCKQLDSQKPHKKALFGSGLLLSEKAAAEKAAAEKAAAEKAAAEKAAAEKHDVIVWQLSDREINIIKSLK
jgi:hypothetical protein